MVRHLVALAMPRIARHEGQVLALWGWAIPVHARPMPIGPMPIAPMKIGAFPVLKEQQGPLREVRYASDRLE
jgi:hypothetical protein